MNKLIFKKLLSDIFLFFIVAILSISIIIWVIQAVNNLDIISEQGHSLNIYFSYSLLSFPKIISKIFIFVFFISIFYTLNKYDLNNEILVFWSNGIKKISIINFLFKTSILFIIFLLLLNFFIVPKSLDLARKKLKVSSMDFFPSLITEKKFISIFKNLTLFIEDIDKSGILTNIYIKEMIDKQQSKIILAKKGQILKQDGNFKILLKNGSISDINNFNTSVIHFKQSEYDLSKFSSRSMTVKKIQHQESSHLLFCLYTFYTKINYDEKFICKKENLGPDSIDRDIKVIQEEMLRRIIIPLYCLILSLISGCLVFKTKIRNHSLYYKAFVFLSGFIVVLFSETIYKLISVSTSVDLIVVLSPIMLVILFYLFLGIYSKTKQIIYDY